jgi:MFS family permease
MGNAKLASNIPKLFAFAFFQFFLVLMPVLVPFWESKGLTLKEIFLLQGVFGGALVIFDTPAGYAADLFGRKKSMIVGGAIAAIAYQLLWLGNSFWDYVAFEIVCGLGISLTAGCDIALLYNTLEKIESGTNRAGIMGKRACAMTLGEGSAALLCGVLAGVSLSLPIYVQAVTAWIPMLIACTLVEPEGQVLSRESHVENIKQIGRAMFGHSKLLTFVIISFMFYGFATYCAAWALQPFWKSKGLPYEFFGYLWAGNCFASSLVSRYAHRLEVKIGSTRSILVIAALPILGYLGMGLTPGLLGLLFGLAFPICRGLNYVLLSDAINTRVPAEIRSTVNSVANLGLRGLFIVFGPLIGHALDTKGPQHAFVILGIVFIAGFFVIALPLLTQRRHFRTN